MHQFFETLRDEIESLSGNESYLASFPFLYLYQHIKYEDNGETKCTSKESLEQLKNKILTILGNKIYFNLREEILSWQVAIFRHITKNIYLWWIDYKSQYFMKPSYFADGSSCFALEASCEKINQDPTDLYTLILKIEANLILLCTSPNTIIQELSYYRIFEQQITKLPKSEFLEKRKQAEQKRSQLGQSVILFQQTIQAFDQVAKLLAGEDHLLWKTPVSILESSLASLTCFFHFNDQSDNLEGEFTTWFSSLFPKKLEDNNPNFFYESPLHMAIRAKLTSASNLLFDYTIHKNHTVFNERNEIIIEHIKNSIDKIIQNSLVENNLKNRTSPINQSKNLDL